MIKVSSKFFKKYSNKTTPAKKTVKIPKAPSNLEAKFFKKWQLLSKNKLEREYKFHPTRKWPFDFACPKNKIAIEIEGLLSGGNGRHQTISGYTKDCIKYNQATAMGWRVYRLTSTMITEEWIKFIDNQFKR